MIPETVLFDALHAVHAGRLRVHEAYRTIRAAESRPEVAIARVERNGDFQTVYFSDGSHVYTSSEQYGAHGEWRDGTGIEHVIAAFGYDEAAW